MTEAKQSVIYRNLMARTLLGLMDSALVWVFFFSLCVEQIRSPLLRFNIRGPNTVRCVEPTVLLDK